MTVITVMRFVQNATIIIFATRECQKLFNFAEEEASYYEILSHDLFHSARKLQSNRKNTFKSCNIEATTHNHAAELFHSFNFAKHIFRRMQFAVK